jgi:outer membrane lipoprotein-sorting protein
MIQLKMIGLRLITTLFLALLAATFVPGAVLAASAIDVLERAEEAPRRVSYRGFKTATVYLKGCPTTAILKVVHLKPDKTRTEYFTPALLAGVIVIENGSELWRYNPQENEWEPIHVRSINRQFYSGDQHIRTISNNYDVRLIGTDSVAGRPAYVIQAIPKYQGESIRRLWIDREFFLIMGTQIEKPNGLVVSSSRFTELQFNPDDISAAIFKPGGHVKSVPNDESVNLQPMKPTYIPKGYRLVGISHLIADRCRSLHMKFSNGINTISLFQHRSDRKTYCKRTDKTTSGILTWQRSGMQFTLIGDLPRAELQKIADSVR